MMHPTTKRVMVELLSYAVLYYGGNAPTLRYLADKLGRSTSIINHHLDKLEDLGHIRRVSDGRSKVRNVIIVTAIEKILNATDLPLWVRALEKANGNFEVLAEKRAKESV